MIIRRDEVNIDIVYASVDGPHEDLVWKKDIFLFASKNLTVDLTVTSNDGLFGGYQWRKISKLPTEYHWWWKKWRKQIFNWSR